MAKIRKSPWRSKVNILGFLVMSHAGWEFWYNYKEVAFWDWHSVTQFFLGLGIVVARTWYTNKPIR